MTRRLGVLGGTFDPIHLGHLILAQEVCSRLNLERILFVPNRDPPHKRDRAITDGDDRLQMVRLAIHDNPAFVLDLSEMEREGPSYAVDTVRALKSRHDCSELLFLLGSDALAGLTSWSRPEELLEEAKLAVVVRPGTSSVDELVEQLRDRFPTIGDRVEPVESPRIEISGADIRRRVEFGRPIRYLVPPAVEEYIRREGLYR